MEKRIPHCRLLKVHSLVKGRQLRITQSALAGAAALGFSVADLVETVLALTEKDFFRA
jgi:motility quorum-sensing regulator/GCU-specific mRNA interferase toxin